MKVVLVADDAAGVHAFRCLVDNGQQIVALLTGGRVADKRDVTARDMARRMDIPIWPISLVNDPAFAGRIRSEGVDLLLNIHSLQPIHGAVAQAVSVGAFNLHPGPLPEYAGANVVSWALYCGATTFGSTLHWVGGSVHGGATAYQSEFDITESDSALTLYSKCVSAGLSLVEQLLIDAEHGSIPVIPQDPKLRRVFGHGAPDDGCLRWARPASEIVNFVRACDYLPFRSPWGHPRARVRELEFVVTNATRTYEVATAAPGVVGAIMGRSVCVAGRDEWLLLNRVGADGHHFDAADMLRTGDHIQDGTAALFARQPIKAG